MTARIIASRVVGIISTIAAVAVVIVLIFWGGK